MSETAPPASWTDRLAAQWKDPKDIFPLLLIIGGDVVHQALAQFVGNTKYIPAPVPFSFGWVAYAYNSVMLRTGEGRMMPTTTDHASILINSSTGIPRVNNSWVLGRLLRDREREDDKASLLVDVFEVDTCGEDSVALERLDGPWWTGAFTIVGQIAIASVCVKESNDWSVFIIVVAGTVLAMLTSLLPQWREEKWISRNMAIHKRKTVCLTKGNGSRYAMILDVPERGVDLEALATARSKPSGVTKILTYIFALLWMALLLTATSVPENTWYLVGIGLVGMLQNLYAASAKRSNDAHGFKLTHKGVFGFNQGKVMEVLYHLDFAPNQKGWGRSLVFTFFGSSGMRPKEKECWKNRDSWTGPGEYPPPFAAPPTLRQPVVDEGTQTAAETTPHVNRSGLHQESPGATTSEQGADLGGTAKGPTGDDENGSELGHRFSSHSSRDTAPTGKEVLSITSSTDVAPENPSSPGSSSTLAKTDDGDITSPSVDFRGKANSEEPAQKQSSSAEDLQETTFKDLSAKDAPQSMDPSARIPVKETS